MILFTGEDTIKNLFFSLIFLLFFPAHCSWADVDRGFYNCFMENTYDSYAEVIELRDEYVAHYKINQEGTHNKDEIRLDLQKILMMDLTQGVTDSGWVINDENMEYQINVSQANAIGISYKENSTATYYDDEDGLTSQIAEIITHDLIRETKDKKYIRKLRVRKILVNKFIENNEVDSTINQKEVVEDLLGICEKLQVSANHTVKL